MNKFIKKDLLSICIATYNQPIELRRLLECLKNEIRSEVEIIIRDDSTNDESKKISEEFSVFLPIKYFHGEKQGLDVAILFLTEQASGEYVWWLGNDLLVSGAISNILNLIHTHTDLTFIWLNSRNIHNKKDIAFSTKKDLIFYDHNEVLKINVGLLGFISATIFRRSSVLGGIESAKKYIGSAFVNLYLILYVLSGGGKKILISTPHILCEPKPAGEIRWYDQFQVFGINLCKIVCSFSGKFENKAIRIALRKNLRQIIKAVLVERGMGLYTGFGSTLPKILPMIKCYWSYWETWVALPFFILPRTILIFLYPLFKKIKNNFYDPKN